jgi:cyclopropane-fatty-acyl-phospholipid synthase
MKWTERLLRAFLERLVTRGALDVFLPSGKFSIGDGGGPNVAIRFADAKAVAELLRDPDMKFGELYVEGRLTLIEGDLPTLVSLLFQNGVAMRRDTARKTYEALRRFRHRVSGANGFFRARRNVERHYDLSARFYELFLDEDRQYSCAYFETPGLSLEEAQRAKRRRIAAKLLLEPGLRVLDIGSGFGGLALYLADVAGAGAVAGVTLSQTQIEVARQRAQSLGLTQVRFDLRDYRDVEGIYDRIVSVGMFEHVGPKRYETFFRKCASLLAEDGVMLLQTIGHTSAPGVTNPWIVKYIFPGGYLPALSEVSAAIEKAGLLVADVEVLRHHYADTLREWRRRFTARREEARALYDERFCRMWEFYLTICEASFRQLDAVVFQVQITRRNDVVPITRAYIAQTEAKLERIEAGREPLAAE